MAKQNGAGRLSLADFQALVVSAAELASEIDFERLLQHILRKACELTDSEASSVIMHNPARGTLYFAAASGPNAEFLLREWGEASERQVPIEGSKAGNVFSTGESIIVQRGKLGRNHFKGVDQDTTRVTESMVCVPLAEGGTRLGVVQLLNKRRGEFTLRDQTLLEHFANLAAIAIRNARLFVNLLAHMGLYTSRESGTPALEWLEELRRPAPVEKLTILFADMRGFTQLCHLLNSPETVQVWLNEFVSLLSEQVLAQQGIVNKFLGDGIMAIFRGPDHAARAVRCGFAMTEKFDQLKSTWNGESNIVLDFLDIGIGITTDAVTLGTIGNQKVRDFTVIGSAVNLAAAFEEHARDGRRILADQVTYNAVKDFVAEIEGPERFDLRKPGQLVGHPYKLYHLKSLARPTKTRVFISHNQRDREFVENRLVKPLRALAIETWYSRDDIPKGAAWVRKICEGLRECQWVVVLVSPNSAGSKWVAKEIDLAVADPRFESRIIPLVLEDTPLDTVNEWLSTMQALFVQDNEDLAETLKNILLPSAEG